MTSSKCLELEIQKGRIQAKDGPDAARQIWDRFPNASKVVIMPRGENLFEWNVLTAFTFAELYEKSDEDRRFDLDERAAIMEYHGGMSRAEAERETARLYGDKTGRYDLDTHEILRAVSEGNRET